MDYQFRCAVCGVVFVAAVSIGEDEDRLVTCSKCTSVFKVEEDWNEEKLDLTLGERL